MGSKDVPITNPITLSGGATFDGRLFANSKGGLAPVKQQVPGGIIGLTGLDWLVNFLNLEGLKLYAVTELAGQPRITNGAVDLELPIRVHLINSVLGNNCYVRLIRKPNQTQPHLRHDQTAGPQQTDHRQRTGIGDLAIA